MNLARLKSANLGSSSEEEHKGSDTSDVIAKLRKLDLSNSEPDKPEPKAPRASNGGTGNRAWIIAAVLLAQAGAIGWLLYDREAAPAPQQAATETASVQQNARVAGAGTSSAGAVEFEAQGFTVATRMATVSARVAGIVSEVLIEEGDRVEQGQILGRLDGRQAAEDVALARQRLASLSAQQQSMQAQIERARNSEERLTTLYNRGFATRPDYERAVADTIMARANLETLRADMASASMQIEQQRNMMGDFVIRAPFAGIVVEKNAQPGELLAPTGAGGGFTRTGLATIVDMASLEVVVDVGEQFVSRVAPGQPVEVSFYALPDLKVSGRVSRIMPSADRAKGTVQVRVALDDLDPRILPDMGTKIAFLRCQSKECAK